MAPKRGWILAVVSLLLLQSALPLLRVDAADTPPVQVDNTAAQTNAALRGLVLDDDPGSAKIAVENLHRYWTNIRIQGQLGVEMEPANPLNLGDDVGGIYAALGVIGPENAAVWDATFDLTGSASVIVVTTPSVRDGGRPTAGMLNLVTILMDMAGGSPKVQSLATVEDALGKLEQSENFMAAAEQLAEGPPPLSFAMNVIGIFNDDAQLTILQEAFAMLGLEISKEVLKDLITVYRIWELSKMAADMGASIVLESHTGHVRFYQPVRAAATPVPSPAPTATPRPGPTATATPATVPTPDSPNLTFADMRQGILWMEWEPSQSATGYRVYMQIDNQEWTLVREEPGDSTGFNVMWNEYVDVNTVGRLCWGVSAFNKSGESPISDEYCFAFGDHLEVLVSCADRAEADDAVEMLLNDGIFCIYWYEAGMYGDQAFKAIIVMRAESLDEANALAATGLERWEERVVQLGRGPIIDGYRCYHTSFHVSRELQARFGMESSRLPDPDICRD